MFTNFLFTQILLVIFILPLLIEIIIFIFKKDQVLTFLQVIFFSKKKSYFSNNLKVDFIDKLIFIPHPFLNWSLNPQYKNSKNEIVHTKEGFRKTFDDESIIDYLKKKQSTFKIVCIGGSTTHCSDMDDYRDTWPALLQKKLNKENDFTVINFGVGAWSTIQSQIRCLTWLKKINPNLLIFYQCKNDITPLMNGSLNEKEILPDYQNITSQFSEKFFMSMPKFFLFFPLISLIYLLRFIYINRVGLLNIYKPKAEQNPEGMKRLNDEFIDAIYFRHLNIVKMCNEINCKVLYVPEIVTDGIYRDILTKKIYPNLEDKLKLNRNLELFNIDPLIPKSKEFFWDKMHFTKKGNQLFSDLLSKKILKTYSE